MITSGARSLRMQLSLWSIGIAFVGFILIGFVSIFLEHKAVVANEQSELLAQTKTVASDMHLIRSPSILKPIARTLKVTGYSLMFYRWNGTIIVGAQSTLPAPLVPSDIPPQAVLDATPISATVGKVIFAAVPAQISLHNIFSIAITKCAAIPSAKARRNCQVALKKKSSFLSTVEGVVVVFARQESGFGDSIIYFLVASSLALIVVIALVLTFSRRITRYLTNAARVTVQIANGDLTARVPLEDSRYSEIVSLAHSINIMADSLSNAQAAQHNFLLSISHDLRTPLTSIRGFTEAIIDGVVDDVVKAGEVILDQEQRLERLIGDLLDLTKLDTNQFTLDMKPINISQVVSNSVRGFQQAFDTEGLRLSLGIADENLWVNADTDRLSQVFSNLIENAFKFARNYVDIRVERNQSDAVVSIEDDGPGIPAKDLPYIFERLYSSSSTPARQIGTGLGLTIVLELLNAMGGSIRAVSPPDANGYATREGVAKGGTLMVVKMPLLG
ncbi:MAG: HAMP domain-containing histidine kinase [Actinobacteria bacterium]|nr:HAMP domain-containing histidine kinase [Actinomycetota bacterium]MCL6105546.1 HAMP domain-containing histidine kinase [Actinomycetota bacterium]